MNQHVSAALPTHSFSYRDSDQESDLPLNLDFMLARSDYQIRLAREHGELRTEVNKLVVSLYGLRGLGTVTTSRSNGQPKQITLAACRGNDVFGTLTLGMDSDAGLLADSLYRPEIDTLRKQGKRVCEVTRLAHDSHLSGLEALATLFNVAFVLASKVHGRTDLIAEVHPRHVPFYRRSMGYRVVGPERMCLRVGAPAILMHLCLDFAGSQIHQRTDSSFRQDRNLYRLFLPIAEQSSLLKKLTMPCARLG